MSRLLLLSPKIPFPPEDGGRIATWNLSRCLAHNGYRIDLVGFARDAGVVERHAEALGGVYASVRAAIKQVERQHPLDLLRALAGGGSYFVRKFRSRGFERRIEESLSEASYAVTVLDTAYSGVYLPLLEAHAARTGRLVLRLTNVEHEIFERLAALEPRRARRRLLAREARLFRRFELDTVRRAPEVLAISRRDAEILSAAAGRRVGVLDPFIDTEELRPAEAAEIEPRSVVCVGDLGWPPNRDGMLWFHRRIWPRVLERFPDARSYVVGKNPPPEIERLAGGTVTVTGFVDDVRPYLRRAHLFVAPLLGGSGVRIKILMALAMGKPVLSTRVGAEGIDFDGVVRRDRPEGWIEEIARVFGDEPRVDAAAVRHVTGRYDWRRKLTLEGDRAEGGARS